MQNILDITHLSATKKKALLDYLADLEKDSSFDDQGTEEIVFASYPLGTKSTFRREEIYEDLK